MAAAVVKVVCCRQESSAGKMVAKAVSGDLSARRSTICAVTSRTVEVLPSAGVARGAGEIVAGVARFEMPSEEVVKIRRIAARRRLTRRRLLRGKEGDRAATAMEERENRRTVAAVHGVGQKGEVGGGVPHEVKVEAARGAAAAVGALRGVRIRRTAGKEARSVQVLLRGDRVRRARIFATPLPRPGATRISAWWSSPAHAQASSLNAF